jgi:hypothetical protein
LDLLHTLLNGLLDFLSASLNTLLHSVEETLTGSNGRGDRQDHRGTYGMA